MRNLTEAATSESFVEFWTQRHLVTLSTVRPDGTVQCVPVGATLDVERAIARIISSGSSSKVGLIRKAGAQGAIVSICQVDGARWSTLEGRAVIKDDAESVLEAEKLYTERYKKPRENPLRVAIEVTVSRVLGNQ
jgi:hypothetical protein